MNITNEAIDFLKQALVEETTKSVRIGTEAGCCGPTIGLSVMAPETSDDVTEYDGLTFAVAQDAKALADGVTLDVESSDEGTGLVLRGLNPTC